MGKILITGGSGLVGTALTELLLKKGFEVEHLSRTRNSRGNVRVRIWDLRSNFLEKGALENIDGIIHLAGAGIASVKHDEKGKKLLTNSRVKSAAFLLEKVKEHNVQLAFFISASAIGYYGMETSETIKNEDSDSGHDFVAELCRNWEAAADDFSSICSVAKIRIGLVMDKDGGALKAISMPTQFGLGSALGSGKQWLPWIHKDDLARIFLHIIEQRLSGTFNGVAPEHVNNKGFTKAVANAFGVPMFLPNIPAAIMKLALREKAPLVLEGTRVTSEKIQKAGFEFKFPDLKSALADIYD